MPIRLKGGRHKYQILIIMGSSKPRSKADVRKDMEIRTIEKQREEYRRRIMQKFTPKNREENM